MDRDDVCRKCGKNSSEISERGAYLTRVNEKGVPGIWECRPDCKGNHGDQNDALLRALRDNEA